MFSSLYSKAHKQFETAMIKTKHKNKGNLKRKEYLENGRLRI